MDNKEFRELFAKSGLTKKEAMIVLACSRQTIYNYLKGGDIPESRVDFIRGILSRPKEELKRMAKSGDNYTVESVMPFVVKNFDEFMTFEDFHRKVYIKGYDIAQEIIEKKKQE